MNRERYPLANALYQWEEGDRRLRELARDQGAERPSRAVEAVCDELRRRLGPTYTVAELADLYAAGTDWCLEVAARAVPGDATDYDPQAIADGAFYAHLRGAADWAGGRVVPPEDDDDDDADQWPEGFSLRPD